MTSLRWVWGRAWITVLVGCGGHAEFVGADEPDATTDGGIAPGEGGVGTDGSTGADGGTSTDGGAGVDGSSCFTDDGGIRSISKACTNTVSCAITTHGGCCGALFADGINHAFVEAFNKCEAAADVACGPRGCVSGPTYAEDGKMGTEANIRVRCDNGVCRTSVN